MPVLSASLIPVMLFELSSDQPHSKVLIRLGPLHLQKGQHCIALSPLTIPPPANSSTLIQTLRLNNVGHLLHACILINIINYNVLQH